jgi:hypothetical protein
MSSAFRKKLEPEEPKIAEIKKDAAKLSRFESLLNKIQNKFKDYCEFKNICPYFDLVQFTCTNKGGSQCRKYQLFKIKTDTERACKTT